MRILVIGAEGQVGTFLLRELAAQHQVFGTAWSRTNNLPPLDIRDAQAVHRHLREIRPEHVILTAAMTYVDGCEEQPDEAQAINVQGTGHVAQACRTVGAAMTFFSSDYVFDGQNGPYHEDDTPRPQSVYARSKWEGERMVAETVAQYCIIRPMFVFSFLPDSMNFFMQISRRAEQGEALRVPEDQWGNPIHAVNLAGAVGELITIGARGVYHVAGTTRLSKADFARRIVTALGANPELVQPVATAELGQKAPRPLASGLHTDKAQALLKSNPLWDVDAAIQYAINQRADYIAQHRGLSSAMSRPAARHRVGTGESR